jgi:hypothetical protein
MSAAINPISSSFSIVRPKIMTSDYPPRLSGQHGHAA